MAQLFQSFNTEEMPQGSGSFDPVPAGNYTANITSAEVKTTKDGSGQYIAIRFDIVAPSHEGRVVFANLNIKNNSAKAEEIGRQQLGEIMRAIGLSKVTDTDELLGGTLQIKLTIKEASENYPAGNEIKGYKSAGDKSEPFVSQPSAHKPSHDAANSNSPPWAKR